jgi:subtilisin-like proprotein convertase family protein
MLNDPSAPVKSTISLEPTTSYDFLVESVDAFIDLRHFSRGDMEIILTFPQGTESIFHPGRRRPENTLLDDDQRWNLLTVRSWGESARGNWTLVIRDISAGDFWNVQMRCASQPGNQ